MSADIYSRAHQQAAGILKGIELIGGFVTDSARELTLQIELLATIEEFTRDAGKDALEAIARLKELPASLDPILSQLPEDLSIISRGIDESVELAKQARGRLETADEYLKDVAESAGKQVNVSANIATLMRGRQYMMASNRELFKKAIELWGVEVVRDMIAEIEADG